MTSSEIVPPDERERLEAVSRYDILDTPPDGAFDRIAALAARFFDVPVATVSIVDHDRIWFKAAHGVEIEQIGRDPGLCASVILQDDAYVVTNAIEDPRTLDNPLVRGELGLRFYAAAPIKTRDGYNLGTINVIDTQPRTVTDDERTTLLDLASLVADELELRLEARRTIELERARKREAEWLTDALEERLLPGRIPEVPRLDLATHYQPVSPALEAGGDFYDVFDLEDGLWGLVVGDVCGKGPRAAALTGEVRHMLRALARVHTSPRAVLATLNEVLVQEGVDQEEPGERFCTACYLLIDTTKQPVEVSLCSAGHPLPLVRRADGRVEAAGEPGQLLGPFPDASLIDHTIELAEGDTLLLYTDGVIEQRGTSPEANERALREAFAAGPSDESSRMLARVRDTVGPPTANMTDDVAMLLARVVS